MSEDNFQVLVVGAGFGGLSAAIGCARQGIPVTLIERGTAPSPYGDAIGFAPNSSRICFRWGIGDKMWEYASHGRYFNVRDGKTGKIVFRDDHAREVERYGWTGLPGHRAYYHSLFWDLAVKLGVNMRLGTKVIDYKEPESDEEKPCVILENGEKVYADAILAAEGIGSKAKELVLGFPEVPQSSGYAIYRAYAPATPLLEDPETSHLCDGSPHIWLGPDKHTLLCTFGLPGNITHMSFAMTHVDRDNTAKESWSSYKPSSVQEALETLGEGWDPLLSKAISKFTDCIDWKLAWRDPLPRWVSEKGRITLLGDAAHPFLPTSAQGASQALEDGATLGVCLALVDRTPAGMRLALRAFQDIRHERASGAQESGRTQLRKWHITDASTDIDFGLDSRAYYDHDAELHALDSFESTARMILNDSAFSLNAALLDQVRKNVEGDTVYRKGVPEDIKSSWYSPPFEIPERDRP